MASPARSDHLLLLSDGAQAGAPPPSDLFTATELAAAQQLVQLSESSADFSSCSSSSSSTRSLNTRPPPEAILMEAEEDEEEEETGPWRRTKRYRPIADLYALSKPIGLCAEAGRAKSFTQQLLGQQTRQDLISHHVHGPAATFLYDSHHERGNYEIKIPPPPGVGILLQRRLDPAAFVFLGTLLAGTDQSLGQALGQDDSVFQGRAAALAEVGRHGMERVAGHADVSPADVPPQQVERRPVSQGGGRDAAQLAPLDDVYNFFRHLRGLHLAEHELPDPCSIFSHFFVCPTRERKNKEHA
ncbi:hypothetical protein MUK42_10911 [Musa troglodytarum]|uniref:Uncharacterized protein n=1 Tax=Musa troglodytarum TaxID=320322 RepID=A0A9E7GGE1_9LILI|nr:hypothetical protein MUK42_10911 [Musa troglodytarum]